VVLLDLRMPPTFTDEGLQAAERIRAAHPDVALLLLSQYADIALAARLVDTLPRAAGYLLKERIGNTGQLTDALRRVTSGELVLDPDLVRALVARRRTIDPLQRLSERERAVLTLMAEGRSNAGIAARLYLSPKSVERNVAAVFDKLGLPPDSGDNRRVLAVIAFLRAPA
jgi:DNA-binding NarL/FixJ family response regulator